MAGVLKGSMYFIQDRYAVSFVEPEPGILYSEAKFEVTWYNRYGLENREIILLSKDSMKDIRDFVDLGIMKAQIFRNPEREQRLQAKRDVLQDGIRSLSRARALVEAHA